MKSLERDFNYYIDHQQDLVAKHAGKFIVIKDQEVVGAYDSQDEAYQQARQKFKLGTFLIQHVESGEANYTQTFHSH